MYRAMHFSFLLFFLFLFQQIRSQDVIYLNNGTKFDATVKEINAAAVKYKNFNNPDGPTYVVAKNDILLIEYKNGSVDIINKNPISLSPVKTETVIAKKEVKKTNDNINYMNKNCLYLNGLAFVNSDIALILDREICKQKLSLVFLGAYNFNVHTNYTNSYIQALGISKKNYDLGFGINYYTQTRKNSQYFVGLLFKVMHYEYVRETTTTDIINGLPHTSIKMENANGFQFSSMLVNGLQFRMNPFFTYRVFVGLGFTNKDADISRAVSEDLTQKPRSFAKAYLGMCIGYRF